MANCNLRFGKNHSMIGAIESINKCLQIAERPGIINKVLFRLDSSYDASDLIKAVNDGCIIKRNISHETRSNWLDQANCHCS